MISNQGKEILNRIIKNKEKNEVCHISTYPAHRCNKNNDNKVLLNAISLVREKYIEQDEVDIAFLFELNEFEKNVKNGLIPSQNIKEGFYSNFKEWESIDANTDSSWIIDSCYD